MSRYRTAATATLALATCAVAATGVAHTYASWSDEQTFRSTVKAGIWAPNPPAACGPLSDYDQVIYLTQGNDVWPADGKPPTTNHRQIIMGYGGNDTVYAGNSGDCLVGGEGNDKLYGGNAKDILIGGAGDDYLNGGNAKDNLDGGGDAADICDGGNGKDTVTNCGSAS